MTLLFTALFKKLMAILGWVAELWLEVFKSLWRVVTDLVSFVFESGLDLAIEMLQGVDLSGIQNYTTAWGSLPGQVLEVLGAAGVGVAFGIVGAAILVRLVLQLIPFTRLGS